MSINMSYSSVTLINSLILRAHGMELPLPRLIWVIWFDFSTTSSTPVMFRLMIRANDDAFLQYRLHACDESDEGLL